MDGGDNLQTTISVDSVMWVTLDNPDKLHVTMYRIQRCVHADTTSTCAILDWSRNMQLELLAQE